MYSNIQKVPLFGKWFHFFRFVNHEEKNREILIHYFFVQFSRSPQLFYEFLVHFKKKIRGTTDKELSRDLALKYLDILSPLCERFGIFDMKKVLDTICFRMAHPNEHKEIEGRIRHYKLKSRKYIKNVLKVIEFVLKKEKIPFELSGRYKSAYSIYKKLERFPLRDVLGLQDIFAFRIILEKNEFEQCFQVLSLLHDHFYPIPEFYRDYITVPKINGYQSLHTGLKKVIRGLDLVIEVQIRTKAMHDFSEHGLASHWLYARSKESRQITEQEERLLSYIFSLSHPKIEPSVHCFSSNGDIIVLEQGSTIIDFAYHIHTDVGHKALYALVNGKPKALNHLIQDGDQIMVLKGPNDRVMDRWLREARTPYARKKIFQYLKKYDQKVYFEAAG